MKTNQELYKEMVDMHRDLIVVMQSAYIEWKRGEGADIGN